MVIDIFLFHGELDILELRLNILGDVVDKFVICEANQHLSGEPYESAYQANKERFKKWEDKIVNFRFDLMEDPKLVEEARQSKNTDYGNPYWMKVYYMFEMMRKPLENCKDDDIIMISDADEIWKPQFRLIDDRIFGFKQLVYYYQLNNRCSEPWIGTIALTYKRLKGEIINNIKQKGEYIIPDGGWHFTYQGDEKRIREKITTTGSGTYYNIPVEQLMGKIKEGKDFFNRDFKFWVDEKDWPQYLKDNREKYKHLLKS